MTEHERRTVLVPLDGSKFAEWALPHALGLAEKLEAGIELVAVAEEPVLPFDEGESGSLPLSLHEIDEALRRYLEGIAGRLGEEATLPVRHTVLAGRVADSIEDHVGRTGAEAVVMATHGRGPAARAWLGSVADHVMRHVDGPVLLVRPYEGVEVDLSAPWEPRRVVVPLDGSERAETSLAWARRLVRGTTGGRIVVARVVPAPRYVVSAYPPDAALETHEALAEGREEADVYLDGVVRGLGDRGVDADARVVSGVTVAQGILRAAREESADAIVLATRGHGGLSRLVLGSVADKVVRAAPVPTLVVHPAGE